MQNLIENKIISVGATDPDRKFFDSLIPLSYGTSYNSYLIKGSEKIALVDTVDPSKTEILLKNILEAGIDKIDYIIANHAEQDHSGSLPLLLEKYPDAKVFCSIMCRQMLIDLLHVNEDRIQTVKDKEQLSLGDKTLEFIYTPWVHWPETMVTYLQEDKILFSCDFFGAHLACDDMLVCDQLKLLKATKNYFAEIMMPFRIAIKNNLSKLAAYKINLIAPSHGPVHREPKTIIANYEEWTSAATKNLAIIAYASMHGSTKVLAELLRDELLKNEVETHLYDISNMNLDDLAADLVDASTFVIGTPCVLGGIHPSAASLLYLINALKPKTKFVSILGSFGWSGGIVELLMPMINSLKAELLPTVVVKGLPKDSDLKEVENLAMLIKARHSEV